jgi:hypothetical protein
VIAAVDHVPGKPTEVERELASEIKKSADKDQEAAEEEKRTAEFAERVHRSTLLALVHRRPSEILLGSPGDYKLKRTKTQINSIPEKK